MPDLVELTHPDLPGEVLNVSPRRAAHHERAGWVPSAPAASAPAETPTIPTTED